VLSLLLFLIKIFVLSEYRYINGTDTEHMLALFILLFVFVSSASLKATDKKIFTVADLVSYFILFLIQKFRTTMKSQYLQFILNSTKIA
jgi:hypothetical protein